MSVRWWREKQQRFHSRCRWWRSELAPAFGQLCPLWTNPVSGQNTPANIQYSECMWSEALYSLVVLFSVHPTNTITDQQDCKGREVVAAAGRFFRCGVDEQATGRAPASPATWMPPNKWKCWHLRQSASELIPFGASCTHHSEWSPRMHRRLRSSPANREQIIRRQELSVLFFLAIYLIYGLAQAPFYFEKFTDKRADYQMAYCE